MRDVKNSMILVVDDNPANLGMLFEYLSKYEFNVRVAQSGNAAFEFLRSEKPALILLDIMMPGMDGYEICRRLKENQETRDIPVIFMSALSDTVDKLKGFYMGGVDYITKPFQTEEVLARVTIHLNLRNLQHSLQAKNQELKEEIAKREQVESLLRQQSHRLNERLKEINCLYGIFALVEKPGITIKELLKGIVHFIPPAWSDPKNTCARIVVQNVEFTTKNFQVTPRKRTSTIMVFGERFGKLEVFSLKKNPAPDEELFTEKEKKLLHTIAKHLAKAIERIAAEKELKKYRKHVKGLIKDTIRQATAGER
jgi:DNA-binding response OmpR family regulator